MNYTDSPETAQVFDYLTAKEKIEILASAVDSGIESFIEYNDIEEGQEIEIETPTEYIQIDDLLEELLDIKSQINKTADLKNVRDAYIIIKENVEFLEMIDFNYFTSMFDVEILEAMQEVYKADNSEILAQEEKEQLKRTLKTDNKTALHSSRSI